ncbi:hypothetical protein ACEXOR_01320, partial [Herbiconiux sp. P13]
SRPRDSSRMGADPAASGAFGTSRGGAGGFGGFGGFGVLTMRERARALGGFAVAGMSGGEWLVHAELPVTRLRGPG